MIGVTDMRENKRIIKIRNKRIIKNKIMITLYMLAAAKRLKKAIRIMPKKDHLG